MARRSRAVIFDFDGTVSLGDGPVLRYAHHIATTLEATKAETLLETIAIALVELDDAAARINTDTDIEAATGTRAGAAAADPAVPRAIDGYDLVRRLGATYGVADHDFERAYDLSRRELATHHAPVTVAPGLPLFLDALRSKAALVLATNAPDTRLPEALTVLGLENSFDAVYTSVGKPGGFDGVVDRVFSELLDASVEAQQPASTLLSIGDVWENDLAPATRRGFSTALVGARWNDAVPATYRSERLDELFPELLDWASR